MKKNIFTLLACLMVCCFGFAQNNIIDNELQKILNQKGNDYIDVNIMLKAQMTSDDFAVLNCKSDSKEVRREIVTNELKKFAEKSQRDIMSVINAEERSNSVIDIKSYWIANFINCKAKADVIYKLASHPDVAAIIHNAKEDAYCGVESDTETRNIQATTGNIAEHVTQVKADKVWDLGYTGKGVVVAVLDSGVNTNHIDIKNNLWNGNAQYGYNVVNPGQLPSDHSDHGTHCAGVIAGDGTGGTMTGIAPDAQVMCIKIHDATGLSLSQFITGIEWAAEKKADILSISQGFKKTSTAITDAGRATMRSTFENLLELGIIAAVASGNEGNDLATLAVPHNVRTPGNCPPPWIHPDQEGNNGGKTSVISVGAVDKSNSIVGLSAHGPVTWQHISGYNDYPYNPGIGLIRPDICAPGHLIESLANATSGYRKTSGTSQATPCVAGVMALMLEKNPDLTPEDLCRIIETTASNKPATKDNRMGSGIIDALAAVQAVNFNTSDPVINLYSFTRNLTAGSNLNFELSFINNGGSSSSANANVTISTNDAYTTIVSGSQNYSSMTAGATATATFVISINPLVEDNHIVELTINGFSKTYNVKINISNELVAPTLTATANGTDINLSWNETNNATSYNIYRDGAFLANTTETSYTDTGLEYGTIYAYTVTSKRNDLESEHSLTARAQTEDNPNRPSPTNVVATNNGTSVNVTWTNGANSNASNIYRKDITTGTETNIATNVNGDSYIDNNWDSVEDGIYQYGVANTYAANENLYTEGFENTTITADADEYTSSNAIWYKYNEGSIYDKWEIKGKSSHSEHYPYNGQKAAFFNSTAENLALSYLVSPQFDFTEHNGSTVKLSFYYITPEWSGYPQCVNRLRVKIGTSPTGPWEETSLWSNNQVSVAKWTKVEIDLSAYVNNTFYIAFENAVKAGHCSAVDDINISIEGSSESRIEWSDNVYKNVNIFVQDGLWSNTDNWSAKRLPNETEKVIIDANATITSDSDITVYSLLINEGKSLTLNSDVKLRVTDDFVNNDADAFIINDGAQVFQSNDDVAATFLMNIVSPRDTEGYSSEEEFNPTGWQFIASPMKDAKINDFVPTFNYDLFKYDGTQELEWLNHKYEPTVLTAPQNLMAEATGTTTVRLSWAPVEGATSYNVYYDGNDVPLATTADNIFEITGLTSGTEYCYTVTSATADNESEKPSAVCTKTITLAPQLVANMASHSSIVLSWNAVAGAELYNVYKGNEKIASVTSLAHTVTGLDPATTYCFTVTSVGSEFLGIESAKSNEACATTDVTIPSAPQNVVLVATSPYSVKLTWDPVAGADSYNIYFIAGGEAAIDVKATEYIFEGLTPGMGYCYNVTAVNTKGESQPSGSNSVNTPLPTPEAPQLTATDVGSAVELTWTAPAYAATYKVYDEEGLVAEGIFSTTYTVYDLEAGEHCFTVIAVNAEGSESVASNQDCATTTAQDPDAPIAEHVIIGEGNSTSIALPIYSNCAYSISQQIYTRAEIGQTGSIKAVSFKYKSGVTSSCTRTVKVYLQQTTKAFFTSGTDWVSMTEDADLVYDGNITINGITDEWVRIKLNTPFEYTRDNLVVCVYDYTGKVDSEITFAADQINELKGMSYYNTISPNPLDPSNVNKTGFYNPIKRNQIRFSFVTGNEPAIPAAPTNLIASCSQETPDIDVYANAITLTWDADATAETYHIYDKGGNKIGQTGGTTFTIEGLECATRYCYYVSAENETGEGAKAEVCTTTITEVPQNVVARSTDETTINMSWDPVETATSYKVYDSDLLVGTTTTTSFDITGLTTGDTYCHSVTAVNEGGESKKSALGCAKAGDIQLETIPVTFTLRDIFVTTGDGWDPNYGGNWLKVSYEGFEQEYTINKTFCDNGDLSSYTFTLNIPKGYNVTLTYRKANSQYASPGENSFDVKCENGLVLASAARGSLTGGEVFEFIADCTPPLPNAPVLEANATSSSTIVLSWNVVTGATSYNIYRNDVLFVNVTETTYTFENLTAGTEYCFEVSSVNTVGESDATKACATTEAATVEPEQPETCVTVGSGTEVEAFVPAQINYDNTISQQIYLAEDFQGETGKITSYAFKCSKNLESQGQAITVTRNFKVYMVNTDKSSFTSKTDWAVVTESDLVFDGSVTFQPKDEWTVITFNTPFEYEKGKNVLICINDASDYVNATMNYYSHVTENVRSLVSYVDGNPYDATAIAVSSKFDNMNYVAQAQFTFAKSSSASAKMTDIKGGFEKASSFGTSSGTELSRFEPTFQQGVGYLASYEIETTATFKGTLNHENSFVFNLADYDNNKNVGNFNLLGNPFSFNMDWSKVTSTNLVEGYAVVNEDGGYEYSTKGEIKVGDGFLVKVSGEGPALSYNTRSRKTENESNFLNIVSSGKAGNDNVIIKLDGEQDNFPKLENFNDDIALVYVTDNDIAYGIYNCNSEVQEVSLVFKASRMGEYNLHIKPNGNFDHVTLVDLYNGAETNMLTSSYSFTAIPKENGKRFVLKFAKGKGAAEDKFAFLSGNELIVETEGTVQIIDVMGRMVYSNDVTSDNNRIDVSKFNTAAYIIRLINDNGVKTQKIVVY